MERRTFDKHFINMPCVVFCKTLETDFCRRGGGEAFSQSRSIGLDDKITGHGHAHQFSETHFLGSGLNTDIPSKTKKNIEVCTFSIHSLYYITVCEKIKTLYFHFDSEI